MLLCMSKDIELNKLEGIRGINCPTELLWVKIIGPKLLSSDIVLFASFLYFIHEADFKRKGKYEK